MDGTKIAYSSFVTQSVLRRIHTLFQSELSTSIELVLLLSISTTLSSSNCWSLRPRLAVSSIFSSTACFIRQYLSKMWPMPLAFHGFVIRRKLLSSLTFYDIYCLHDQSSWYLPLFSSTTFQNFLGISDLLSKMSNFQRHTKLWSKCSILLLSSLHLSQFAVEKNY